MNTALDMMLQKYAANSMEEKKNAMKEIIQEVVLCGLSRAGFFRKAAFYGGTALRIFYGLDRFSEDLDFSLMEPDPAFALASYFPILQKEAEAFGLRMSIEEKEKKQDSHIKSAFLKGNTREHLLLFFADSKTSQSIAGDEKIKIKFEVDVTPPPHASFEHKFRLLPAPYEVCLYDMPSLFAGKIHAVLCRAWRNRVKGRDLYDYLFYLSRGAKVNLAHLNERMKETGALQPSENIDIHMLREMLCRHFDTIDYASAKEDVRSFIRDQQSLEFWCPEFFRQVTEQLEAASKSYVHSAFPYKKGTSFE